MIRNKSCQLTAVSCQTSFKIHRDFVIRMRKQNGGRGQALCVIVEQDIAFVIERAVERKHGTSKRDFLSKKLVGLLENIDDLLSPH